MSCLINNNSAYNRLISRRTWLWKIARGISGEEVEDRLLPKSHGCGKTFPGPKALKNNASVSTYTLSFLFRDAYSKAYPGSLLMTMFIWYKP